MNDIKDIVTKPIFFERNRVYRIYHGGKPFKALFDDGYDDGTDMLTEGSLCFFVCSRLSSCDWCDNSIVCLS